MIIRTLAGAEASNNRAHQWTIDQRDLLSHHNHYFYVTASIRDVELNMLELGSSLNIISLLILDIVGIPPDKITTQSMKVSSFFGDNCTYTMGFVNVDLTVWRYKQNTDFMSLILKRPITCCWEDPRYIIASHSLHIPLMHKSYVEGWEGPYQSKWIFISERWGPLSEPAYFYELIKEGEVTPASLEACLCRHAKPQGPRASTW